jgi:RNA polymerase sigma factor (sigma-70 family)
MNQERRSFNRKRERLMPDLDQFDRDQHLYSSDTVASETQEQLYEAVRRAVATTLTDKQREAIEAHFFEGLSQGEIARRLGVSQQVVQKRIYGAGRGGKTVGGALRKLRDALAPLVMSTTQS